MKAREQALFAALDDMESWLATGMVTEVVHSGLHTPAYITFAAMPASEALLLSYSLMLYSNAEGHHG